MNIALVGYGKMGKMIEALAISKGFSIVGKISRTEQDWNCLKNADVCIEFSHPDSILGNLQTIAKYKKNVVIGTTGWQQHESQIKKIVNESGIGALYASNFSIGVYLFSQILNYTAQLMNSFTDYDVAGIEHHHSKKADRPSGTAKDLAKIIANGIERKKDFSFESIRCGSIPGTHSILFDSLVDTIKISHEARNREGFANGALIAANWIQGKKGLFTLEDMLNCPLRAL